MMINPSSSLPLLSLPSSSLPCSLLPRLSFHHYPCIRPQCPSRPSTVSFPSVLHCLSAVLAGPLHCPPPGSKALPRLPPSEEPEALLAALLDGLRGVLVTGRQHRLRGALLGLLGHRDLPVARHLALLQTEVMLHARGERKRKRKRERRGRERGGGQEQREG